jgi:hypothetical protein
MRERKYRFDSAVTGCSQSILVNRTTSSVGKERILPACTLSAMSVETHDEGARSTCGTRMRNISEMNHAPGRAPRFPTVRD